MQGSSGSNRARAFIVGAAALPLNPQPPQSPLHLMAAAVRQALQDAGLSLHQVTGLVASPSLAPGLSFMPAHQLATHLGLLPSKRCSGGGHTTAAAVHMARAAGMGGRLAAGGAGEGSARAAATAGVEAGAAAGGSRTGDRLAERGAGQGQAAARAATGSSARPGVTAASINTCGASPISGQGPKGPRPVFVTTLDAGGASPIAGLALARRMIQCDGHAVVVVAAADAVASMPRAEFLALADAACVTPNSHQGAVTAVPSPVIPNAYDTVARWQMAHAGGGVSSFCNSSSSAGAQGGSSSDSSSSSSYSSGNHVQGGSGGNSCGASGGGGGRLTRRQLAMCASLMTLQASRHPNALTRQPLSVEHVLASPHVAPCTTVLECAKRADGGGAVVLVSEAVWHRMCSSSHTLSPQQHLQHQQHAGEQQPALPKVLQQHQRQHQHHQQQQTHLNAMVAVEVVGTGEASGPIFPPPLAEIDGDTFASCRQAVEAAAAEAGISMQRLPEQVDYWGLYDCFPICLVRAIEAVGLAAPGRGGAYVEKAYNKLLPHFPERLQPNGSMSSPQTRAMHGHSNGCADDTEPAAESVESVKVPEPWSVLPINTHGGLLGQGAPWEAPAMYSLVEAVQQLRWQAQGRQVPGASTALVYGNGGVFSASAVAILKRVAAHGSAAGTPPLASRL